MYTLSPIFLGLPSIPRPWGNWILSTQLPSSLPDLLHTVLSTLPPNHPVSILSAIVLKQPSLCTGLCNGIQSCFPALTDHYTCSLSTLSPKLSLKSITWSYRFLLQLLLGLLTNDRIRSNFPAWRSGPFVIWVWYMVLDMPSSPLRPTLHPASPQLCDLQADQCGQNQWAALLSVFLSHQWGGPARDWRLGGQYGCEVG